MLLAAGGLMFNVACTEDGINGLPGGFGSGQDDATEVDKEDKKKEKDDVTDVRDGGLYVPADGDIWQEDDGFTLKTEE